jgi:hypothetical protein
LVPSTSETLPSLVSIFDFKDPNVRASTIQWLTPFQQATDFPKMKDKLTQAVRAFKRGPWRKLLDVAADQAFHQHPYSFIEDIAEAEGIPYAKGISLFELVWIVVKAITKKTDQEVLIIMYWRLCKAKALLLFQNEVAGLEEALDVLEEADKRKVLQQRLDNAKSCSGSDEFTKQYVAKARELRVAAKPKDPKDKGKGKGKEKKKMFSLEFEHKFDLSQPEVALMCPPGGSIWRSTAGRPAWCAHFPPNPRFSQPFAEPPWTCKSAARYVLVSLWNTYLTKAGMSWDDCPFDSDGAL